MKSDYLIVGAGLTGATIARLLHEGGARVIVLERRGRVGGNVADAFHPSGINVHLYGPHLFRTSSERVWRFVNRFAAFYRYEHVIKTRVNGRLENWPVAGSYIRSVCGADWKPDYEGEVTNFEQAALSLMPRPIYERFVKGYTEKQWGKPAEELAPELCGRFRVHEDDDPRLTPHATYQAIPSCGYSALVANMLAGIPVLLNCDYLQWKKHFEPPGLVIYTGAIDEYFGFILGRLRYRSQRRKVQYLPDRDWVQPCAQVNNPGPDGELRSIEWKHITQPDLAQRIRGTVITREWPYTPTSPDHYEYPFPDKTNAALYARYVELAAGLPVLFAGRLGSYKYYDMDVAIEKAMDLAAQLLQASPTELRRRA